jgi:hypothetical protein
VYQNIILPKGISVSEATSTRCVIVVDKHTLYFQWVDGRGPWKVGNEPQYRTGLARLPRPRFLAARNAAGMAMRYEYGLEQLRKHNQRAPVPHPPGKDRPEGHISRSVFSGKNFERTPTSRR